MNKTIFIFGIAALLLNSCESVNPDSYTFVLPNFAELSLIEDGAPCGDAWPLLLGSPCWHLEWTDSGGNFMQVEISKGSSALLDGLTVLQEQPSAIIAYPYWPDKKIMRGVVKPAGAIFPYDSIGAKIYITWQGGIDANFYREINNTQNEKRLAYKFDWVRFRKLFSENTLSVDVCADPWLADWHQIAERTAASGFDKRRIKNAQLKTRYVVVPEDGPWLSCSPFAKAKIWQKDDLVKIEVRENSAGSADIENYFCPLGTIHINNKIYTWLAF
jgi:hypothetical protein